MVPRSIRAGAAALLALLSACALNNASGGRGLPDPNRLTEREIAASGAANAYDVVQRLRPGWLRQQIDTRYGGQELETLVIHNGTRYGFLGSLRDLPAEMIGSMQFMDGSEAQSLLTSTDRDIAAVVQVFSRGVAAHREMRDEEAGGGGFAGASLSVFPLGYAPRHQPASPLRGAMEEDGWTEMERTDASTQSMMVAAEVRPSRATSVGIVAARRSGADAESYYRWGGQVSFSHTSTTFAGVLGYRLGPVRIGAGPAMQVSTLTHAFGECECQGKRVKTRYLRGGVVEGVAQLRMLRVLTGELRVQRYFLPEQSVETFSQTPDYPLSRAGWFVGLGAGIRLGR